MIKVKHLLDVLEPDDGQRVWVEPIGLTRDLQEWCRVDHVATELGPPLDVWLWFERHPEDYGLFRSFYHEQLRRRRDIATLPALATASRRANITLLHQNTAADGNSAVALAEFLHALGATVMQ
jgi:uncharacterized protein YeaO (DUF488 family)